MNRAKRTIIAISAAAVVTITVPGCSLTGPTCTQFLDMTAVEQRAAVIDWLTFNNMIDDPSDATAEQQIAFAEEFLERQCEVQVREGIPTMLNQFRP